MSEIYLGRPNQKIVQWCKEHYGPTPTVEGLCFTALQDGSQLGFTTSEYDESPINTEYPDINMQYSLDGQTWIVLDLTKKTTPITLNKDQKVYFKAVTSNINGLQYKFETTYNGYIFKTYTGKFNVSGKLAYLLNVNGEVDNIPSGAFGNLVDEGLFAHTSIVNAKDLIFPNVQLNTKSYRGMFMDCASLTQAPALPATNLADYCYAGMFSSCTSLTQAPELPATTLADSCYVNMFSGCTQFSEVHMKSSMQGIYNLDTHGDTTKTVVYDL